MKKILIWLIAFSIAIPKAYSQSQYTWMYNKDGSFNMEDILPYAFITFIILGVLIFGIAKLETSQNTRDRFYKGHQLLYLICVVSLFVHGFLANLEIGVYLLLFMRIALPFFVASDARKLGRSGILWWFISFIALHISLLVLAMSPKLLRVRKERKSSMDSIMKEYDEKLNNLRELKISGALSVAEFKNKQSLLEEIYQQKQEELLEGFCENDSQAIDNSVLEKLKKAYQDGILTEEEYESKRNELIG